MTRVFIVGARRTAFGAFGGALKSMSATDLAVIATRGALASGKISPEIVDTVVVGNVQQTSPDAAYLARHVALKNGMRVPVSALNINRLCGSGFQSCINVAHEIKLGEAAVGVAAGTESMSQAPMSVYGHEVRWGTRLGVNAQMQDTLWAGLTDSHAGCPMGITAENLAADYSITRAESDAYALSSQQRWADANAKGVFAHEIEPIELTSKKGPISFATDEHPRVTTLEKMGALPTTFKKGGVVTAASASGICDGAGALVLASEAAVKKYGLKPLAELVSWANVGVDPTRMGIGPVPAIQEALKKASMSLEDMDRIEINEAFAPQVLACAKGLGIDASKLNINGGAIALGHPLGASGSRITLHLAHAIARGEVKTAVGAACIGGGQGIALVLKAV
ncbi:3-ketoacyl- mitochondrial [Chrysochromulina tobinii]|uniref:3-ketoacyl-mitochondrial n=1 Tax=Chrysochromulina tobinii TaxID=1460289 RepID=A0A0M0JEP8_9EUKA|nr:3-ketoacyl- mitochondrial [Chrysochromulina tobinii]|eukprot:KOO25054.1 3-ketoacyl- mitochondrial [Chrysochromulina sp. CCMP291]